VVQVASPRCARCPRPLRGISAAAN